MPAPPRHQLGCALLPPDVDALVAHLVAVDCLRPDGDGFLPGPRPLVAGGFLRARVMRHTDEQLVSSGQGGFRVFCPADVRNVTAGFAPALEAWRRGGPRALVCACGATHDLAALHYRPACGFARAWLELADVGAAELDVRALPAGVEVVWRRG